MTKTALEQILCDVFRAQGLKAPAHAARRAVEGFQQAERDQRIYEMKSRGMSAEQASAVSGLSIRRVQQIWKAFEPLLQNAG